MNKTRFLNYGRYDLYIHAPFYRNLVVITVVLMTSLALIGFLFRWWDFNEHRIMLAAEEWQSDGSYAYVGYTAVLLYCLMGVMMYAYAACFNHPLTARKDRLKTLTLPATNGEKYLWHLLLVGVGGAALLFASLLLADGLNALFSLLVGFDRVYSLTASVWSLLTMGYYEGMGHGGWLDYSEWVREMVATEPCASVGLWLAVVLSAWWQWSAFIYGSTVKFRYNILWTLLALWVLQMVLSVAAFVSCAIVENMSEDQLFFTGQMDRDSAERQVLILLYSLDFLLLATGACMWWRSWVRFRRVQITSRLNP